MPEAQSRPGRLDVALLRSHPPTLITIARRTLLEECGVLEGEHILVAVSGGGDSLALLHVLALLRPRFRFELSAHGVNHGLRREASGELLLARALAQRCGVRFDSTDLELPSGANLQARAREARYAALRETAQRVGAGLIATGHHADDRAETVLMRLLRGSGPHGLTVLAARAGDLLRPLVRVRRADIQAHLERHRIEFASDPSNQNSQFLRVRVRNELVPLMESMSPRIVEHLCALADDLEGQPPVVIDTEGRPLELGRAQIDQIRRAVLRSSRQARVSVPGGRELQLDTRARVMRLVPGDRTPGDAKPTKRG